MRKELNKVSENIEKFLNTNISVPAVLCNAEGNILSVNKYFIESFGGEVDTIGDFLAEEDVENLLPFLQKVFEEENPASLEINVFKKGRQEKILLKISPIILEAGKYLVISFESKNFSGKGQNKFTYLVEDVEEIIQDEEILEAINKVKSNFPFTIIGKNVVQNQVNKLKGYFWIKDVTRKYILVNKEYAKYLGAKPSAIEGKFESELLPAYVEKIFANTDSYIIETGNSVLIEGIGESFFSPGIKNQKILEFPLLDIDNQVIAIVGLSYDIQEKESRNYSDAEEESFEVPFQNALKKTTESNKMYDEILKQFPEPIFIYDVENLKFLEVNDAALNLYGYTREEFLAMDLTDLYAPEDIQSLIESGNKGKGKYGGPWRQKRKDGSSIIVEIGRVNVEYDGRLAHMSVIHDLTYKMEMQKKLQLYKASFDNSSDAIIITDTHGFIKYLNDNFTKFFGYAKSDVDQSSFLSLVADEDRGKINKVVFQSPVPDVKNEEINIKKSSGETVKVKIVSVPIFDFEEKTERYVLVIKPDVEVVAGALKVTEVKGGGIDSEFLSNLFHELLTPLNVIIGFVQELSESIENPTEDQREAIQIIKENQKVLMQTMDTAVEYSHLEQNNVELIPSEISFVDLLEQLENSTKKISSSNEVELQYGKISSSLKFVSDRQKFLTFIVQILHFAIIMTKESKIYLSANFTDKDKFYVGIKDSKSKISSDLLKNLTTIFTDDENNIRRNFGLSRFTVRLVKKLLTILQAEYKPYPSVDSPNEFALIFPLELKIEEPEEEENEELQEKVEEKKAPKIEEKQEEKEQSKPVVNKEIDLSQLSCLYLEDQIDSQILFRVQMKELRSIEFATSLEKALPLLKSKRFDFILMDINLQGEYNGLDALKIIRQMPGYKDVPIIAVTAYVVPGAAEKFIQAGFSEFITKPLLREKILKALEKVFG